ncbi:MAG: hypothetical protein JW819_06805 [Candidatus Krumholzibacteriota bacterium]|nr:hypothetical protein [Candidatus Krumholzibacteriota bacterium]
MRGSRLLIVLCLASLAVPASAAEHLVRANGSGDQPTIAAALAVAISGDTITLADGTFSGPGNRDLDFESRPLLLRSQSGDPDACVIDCGGGPGEGHRGLRFHMGEGPTAVVRGITITGGFLQAGGDEAGGAVLCEGASPTFEHCVFAGNQAHVGGGLCIRGGSPLLQDCRIASNRAIWCGGGIACEQGAAPLLTDCQLTDNLADYGGGVLCDQASPELTGCAVLANEALQRGGGLYGGDWSRPILSACTLAANAAPAGSGLSAVFQAEVSLTRCLVVLGTGSAAVEVLYGAEVRLECSGVWGNSGGDWNDAIAGQLGLDGNIDDDPQFCGAAAGDYALQSDSPCTAGASACGAMGAFPVLCGADATPLRTWSAIKSLYDS